LKEKLPWIKIDRTRNIPVCTERVKLYYPSLPRENFKVKLLIAKYQ